MGKTLAKVSPRGVAPRRVDDAAAGRGRGEHVFEAVFRNAPDVTLVVDARSGEVLDVNQAVRSYLGYEPEDLIGEPIDILWPVVRADDQPVVDTVRLHGGSFGERLVARIDGSTCCMLMRASLSRLGERQAVILTLHDITARKRTEVALSEAESRYRGIFENAIEGMFQTTPDGRYLSANRALAAIYGYASAEDLMSALTDIAGQLYVDKRRRAEFQRILQEEGVVQGFESMVYQRDGAMVWISENSRAVRDATGKLLYYEGTVVDISERKRLQDEEARAMRELRHASRLKSEFVATMSHELRTPLNIILGYTELLADGAFGPLIDEQRGVLDRVQRTGRDLLELINATLDLSRLDAGALPVEPHTIEMHRLFSELDIETQEVRQKAGVTFSWDLPDVLPALTTDPAKLKLVLKNLIANAMKFTESGRVMLRAGVEENAVVVDVSDTGIGIPEEALAIIFEPFRQVDGSEARRYGGVGLGLHIVKRVLALLGGTIEVASQVGQGSTFRVRLPLPA